MVKVNTYFRLRPMAQATTPIKKKSIHKQHTYLKNESTHCFKYCACTYLQCLWFEPSLYYEQLHTISLTLQAPLPLKYIHCVEKQSSWSKTTREGYRRVNGMLSNIVDDDDGGT